MDTWISVCDWSGYLVASVWLVSLLPLVGLVVLGWPVAANCLVAASWLQCSCRWFAGNQESEVKMIVYGAIHNNDF